jgi:SH3 domain-containing YSC84-like protein 1
MKKLALLSILLIASAVFASDQRAADIERLQTSGVILTQIMSAPDRGIPDAIMDGAKCIAVIPSMLKASFVFGANYGKGVATCRTPNGWSAPAFFKVEGGSFGLQAGGQASDLVLIIRTEDGMQHLLSSKFKLGGDASAAAGPVGRDAQAATDLTLRAQVLTYSRARGLFLGVSLSGAVIHQADGDTQAFYRAPVTYRTILSGQTPAPPEAQPFLQAVEKYAPTPRTHVSTTASAAPTDAESTVGTTPPASTTAAAAPTTSAVAPATTASSTTATATAPATTAPSAAVTTPAPPAASAPANATAPANSADDLSGMMMAPESQPTRAQPGGSSTPAQNPAPATTTKPVTNETPAAVPPPTGKGEQ